MKLILAFILLLFVSTPALSAPFLVCDPYPPEDQITQFVGVLDGAPFSTPYSLHPSGAATVFDLSSLNDGPHTFSEIRAANARGQSPPVPFVLPAVPPLPSHLRMSP